MTGAQVLSRTRLVTNDPSGVGEIWPDANYYAAMSDGLREIYNHQPSSRMQSDGTLIAFSDATSGTLWLDDFYFTALVDYTAYRFFVSDSHDSRDNDRGKSLYTKFISHFQPVSKD
jgi:hypothetical protein